MTDTLSSILGHASKSLGQCAKGVEDASTLGCLNPIEYEQIIGFGMARDWLVWARSLQGITFAKKRLTGSPRAQSLNELTRFTYMWTATNALFARTAVLSMLDPAAAGITSELGRFRILFDNSGISPTDVLSIENTLHSLLSVPIEVKHFPWASTNPSPTILEIIYYKYTVVNEQTRPLGKKLLHASTTGNLSALDLPTLIYATRNWNIHGVLLSSSFRGTQNKFNLWIDTINIALAKVLQGCSVSLYSKI